MNARLVIFSIVSLIALFGAASTTHAAAWRPAIYDLNAAGSNLPSPIGQNPFCNSQTGKCSYTPLEPLGVPIDAAQGSYDNLPFYLKTSFRLLISLGALFAVVMITIAGVSYMVSESGVDIEKAKERAKAALWGLLLLVSCWLILNTINPNLLKFDIFSEDLASSTTAGPNLGPQPAAPANPSVVDQAVQDYYKSSNSSAKVAFAQVVDPNDSDAAKAFNQRCNDLPSNTSWRSLASVCAGGAAGGFIGGLVFLPATLGIGTAATTVGGCAAATYAAYYGGQPTVKTVPGDAAGYPGGTVLSCNY